MGLNKFGWVSLDSARSDHWMNQEVQDIQEIQKFTDLSGTEKSHIHSPYHTLVSTRGTGGTGGTGDTNFSVTKAYVYRTYHAGVGTRDTRATNLFELRYKRTCAVPTTHV